MNALIKAALLLAFLLPFANPLHAQDDACIGLVTPQLASQMIARIAQNDGVGLVLRDEPQLNDSHILMNLREGVVFQVIGESPRCSDGFVWWQVRLLDGQEGYLVEGATTYFTEPYPLTIHFYQADATNPNQINHRVLDTNGQVSQQTPFNLALFAGTGAELWQAPEAQVANLVFADRLATCPDQLPSVLTTSGGVQGIVYSELDGVREFYPAPDQQKLLVLRHYTLDITNCDGSQHEFYGTSYISLINAAGEQIIFPFSQHSDPPQSQFCQPATLPNAEQKTLISMIVWSPDSHYAALEVRYLRDGTSYPCAFYHIFIIDMNSLEVHYAGEGRRLAWYQNRLYAFRHERSDPNQVGGQVMFSILPDGTGFHAEAVPSSIAWLPDAIDLRGTMLPWASDGGQALGCSGQDYVCHQFISFHLRSSTGDVITPPESIQLGATLESVFYVAGNTQLMWLDTDGHIYLQTLATDEWLEVESEFLNSEKITHVTPFPEGVGALLEREDGQFLYLNVLDQTIQELPLN